MNKNVVIVHGSNSTERGSNESPPENERHWKPWLKKELEKRDYIVSNKLYPRDWNPSYEDYKKEFEKNKIDENTILIGHSAGGAFLIRWLFETKVNISKLILVSPGKAGSGKSSLQNLYGKGIYSKISSYVKNEIVLFTLNNDIPSHIENVKEYEKELPCKIVFLKDKGHFTIGDMETEEFPELLEEIIKD